jgi:DNA-directed RNA polymerase subunit RPC12/RpoP
MNLKCTHCGRDIPEGGDVQRVPPPEKLLVGLKSGALGLYPHPDHQGEPDETLHPECCPDFFDPENNPCRMEQLLMEIRESLVEEVREEVREEYREKFESGHESRYCVECWEELEADDDQEPGEPMCPWCKTPEFVWEKSTPSGVIYCCTRCGKYWNEEEEELAA